MVRGPPLSFPGAIAEQIAEAYSVASLTPASLVRHWLPKCDQEVKDKCGYVEPEPEPEPEPEVEAAADGEDGAEKPKEKPKRRSRPSRRRRRGRPRRRTRVTPRTSSSTS